MNQQLVIDGLLVQWGDRLFYPANRRVQNSSPRLYVERAAALRKHIAAIVKQRVPQVMVKVTGGGRGMSGIAAHFRYISKHGRLELEDDWGNKLQGRDAVRGLVDAWRYGGSLIPDESDRREAINIMLSMPRGTDPLAVWRAAKEFAQAELTGHQYVIVLHDHQANPHVHLSVRVESRHGHRLSPRKADLRRWRETFAEKLRGWAVEAGASSRASRGTVRGYEPLWRVKARAEGRLRQQGPGQGMLENPMPRGQDTLEAWQGLAEVLGRGGESDQALGGAVRDYLAKERGTAARERTKVSPSLTANQLNREPLR